jgi:hypothetical protein
MRRIAIVAIVAVAGALVFAPACSSVAYPELRQRSSQPIPGTLTATLEPPGDADPGLAPDAAVAEAPLPAGTDVDVAFARVEEGAGGLSVGPAWVAVARGVCIREDKGELVSDARGNDPNNLDCTRATFLLIALDASTGETLVTITGYDDTLTWTPDVEASDAAVA